MFIAFLLFVLNLVHLFLVAVFMVEGNGLAALCFTVCSGITAILLKKSLDELNKAELRRCGFDV